MVGGRALKRLEDFVVGGSNRVAHAAAWEAARTLGASFNPLVIHGEVGLGKTHLLEGVVRAARGSRPGLRVLHLTAESFTNRFLEAMRGNGLGGFRARHREAELVVVDDVHFLAAKRATQDEFLHTFNALMERGACVVLAMDRHPRQIPRLTEELVTRFLAGMVARVQAPDAETRRAILRSKARARGVEVPEGVLSFVAEHARQSVRELEGALNGLLAHATLTGRAIDLDVAREALRDLVRHAAPSPGLRDVERAASKVFGVSGEALRSEDRSRAVAYPRMLAMYVARARTNAPYGEIGRHFGGRNHSTVIAAQKRVEGWLRDEGGVGGVGRGRGGAEARFPGFATVAEALAALEHALGG